MAETAKGLADYYTAVDTLLARTDSVYLLNDALYHKPYTPGNRELLKRNRAEVATRAVLATDLAEVATELSALSGSTAPADVQTAATKLATDSMTLANTTMSTSAQGAFGKAVGILVAAVQEGKEREAARAMDGVAQGLVDLFVKEEPVWRSIEEVYSSVGGTLAGNLADDGTIDNAALLRPALQPFGLEPGLPPAQLRTELIPVAKEQIRAHQASADADFASATAAMELSLKEMERRVHLLGEDRPVPFRDAPLTLADVKRWVAQVNAH